MKEIIMGVLLVAMASLPLVWGLPIKEEKIYQVKNEEVIEVIYKERALEYEVFFYSEKYKYPTWFINATIDTESEFNPLANSKAGASYGRGLMQVSDLALLEYNNWHTVKYAKEDMYDIHNNMEVGMWYMNYVKEKLKYQNITYSDMYMAYNVGPTYFNNSYKRKELYNGRYFNSKTNTWEKYNALNRFNKYLTKYTEQCKL